MHVGFFYQKIFEKVKTRENKRSFLNGDNSIHFVKCLIATINKKKELN